MPVPSTERSAVTNPNLELYSNPLTPACAAPPEAGAAAAAKGSDSLMLSSKSAAVLKASTKLVGWLVHTTKCSLPFTHTTNESSSPTNSARSSGHSWYTPADSLKAESPLLGRACLGSAISSIRALTSCRVDASLNSYFVAAKSVPSNPLKTAPTVATTSCRWSAVIWVVKERPTRLRLKTTLQLSTLPAAAASPVGGRSATPSLSRAESG
mmetsp:Transcript_24617/g.50506  ORF Transcript_24617/g.50506 Transcript_24617/m.50506 type:complete len:211 (-) Transcript_24617:491-1123(-)